MKSSTGDNNVNSDQLNKESEFIMTSKSKKATAATTIAAAEVQTANATTVVATPTKADKARAIFQECYAMPTVPQRKDIIARMISEAGLTKAGAATYLQNMKNKAGLVVHKTATATA